MKNQMSPRDWQLLSAYMDGQLSERERVQVEQRLNASPELQENLQVMRRNRAKLRSLPSRPVPRNFTLTPDMVPQPFRFRGLFPVLRLSSALAALLVMVMFMVDLLPGVSPAQAPMMQSAALEPAAPPEAGEMSALGVQEEDQPEILYWGGPSGLPYANGVGGGPGMGGGPDLGGGLEGTPNIYHPPEVTSPRAAKPPPLGSAGPEEQPEEPAEGDPGTVTNDAAEPIEGTGPILGVPPAEERGERLLKGEAEAFVAEAAADEDEIAGLENQTWRIAQIGLAVVALLTGLGAWYIHRRN